MLLIQAPGGRLSRSSLAPAHHLAGIHYSVMGMESRGGLAFCHQAWPPRRGGDGGTGEAKSAGKDQGQLTLVLGEEVPEEWRNLTSGPPRASHRGWSL